MFLHLGSNCLIQVSQSLNCATVWLTAVIDGKQQQIIDAGEGSPPILSASILDPYIAICRADGRISFFIGDTVARSVSATALGLVSSWISPACEYHADVQSAMPVMPSHRDLYRHHRNLPYFRGESSECATSQHFDDIAFDGHPTRSTVTDAAHPAANQEVAG